MQVNKNSLIFYYFYKTDCKKTNTNHMDIRLRTLLAAVILAMVLPLTASSAAKSYTLSSPDGKLRAEISAVNNVSYSVWFNGTQVLAPSVISMTLEDGTVLGEGKVRKVTKGRVATKGIPTVTYKKATVDNIYNWLTLNYKGYNIEFRAYDSGIAYRFVSTLIKGDFNVTCEKAEFNFPEDWKAWVPYERDQGTFEEQFMNSFENYYQHIKLSEWDQARLAFLPLVVDAPDGIKVIITESDLYNYPGMFLHGQGGTGMKGVYAGYPKETVVGGYHMLQGMVKSREDYIARASAGQKFPWRIVGVVPEARQLTDFDMVWQLATPAADTDWSWVKPGKVAWDWWNDWNIRGVDFEAGINDATYKYYIDFASKYGIEYVILDEGWAENNKTDLYLVVPEIHLEELVAYAAERNVGLILWAGYKAMDKDIDGICKHFAEMGIKGFKVDFMDRDDQIVVEFYERVARTAAKYHLLLDFHGAFKPAGLYRTYPNVLNFEGVAGLEQMKWGAEQYDQVTYDVIIPFIRMAAGPMDYTQGAMRNAIKGNARSINSEPMSQGTRCRQLAEYAIFDAPLTMLCDTPTAYLAEPECTEFIAGFPTVWDETVPLCGEIGEYVAMARRKGNVWYVGALTDWNDRDLDLDLGFIGAGKHMTIFKDGINANRNASDYVRTEGTVPADGIVKVHMAKGGGWAARIEI